MSKKRQRLHSHRAVVTFNIFTSKFSSEKSTLKFFYSSIVLFYSNYLFHFILLHYLVNSSVLFHEIRGRSFLTPYVPGYLGVYNKQGVGRCSSSKDYVILVLYSQNLVR